MQRRLLNGIELVLILCFASFEVSAQISRQPYLQVVTPTSIVVRWDSDSSRVGTIYYGASPTALTSSTSDTAATIKHELTIAGLNPKQKYYYSVTGASGGSSDQYFVTAPPFGTRQFTRMWVVSDFGQEASAADDARRVVTVNEWKTFNNNDLHADVVLSLGDHTMVCLDVQLRDNFFNHIQGVLKTSPIFNVVGNHENGDGRVLYKQTFSLPTNGEAGGVPSGTEDYYSFDYGNIHVVALSVEGVPIGGAQTAWLQNDLANNKSDWLIAMMHRPMHSAGYHPTDKAGETAPSQKANWLPLLEAAGVDLILSGHNHVYERSYLLDNLTGNSTSITPANKIDTSLGRIDVGGAYRKVAGQPHQGTIFISCESGGTSYDAKYLTTPFSFFPVVHKGVDYEGSLVIDVDGSSRMDVKFLCDELNASGSHIWDYFSIVKVPKATSVAHKRNLLPGEFAISNYPNPFNPSTTISYNVAHTGLVNIAVYDLLGRNVATLVQQEMQSGARTTQWSGKDEQGNDLASGIYLAQLRSGGVTKNTKMILLR